MLRFFSLLVFACSMLLAQLDVPIVFVSRQIPDEGSIHWSVPKGLPGVGAFSRFQVAAPGRLLVREPDGSIRVLVDGANPDSNAFGLIDVSAPDVSFDGTKIVFAGLPRLGNGQSYDTAPQLNPGAWRIFAIHSDGTGLEQLSFSEQNLDLSQFGDAASGLNAYDDTDPVWLPPALGTSTQRIVFSSTRWPAFSHYGGARTTQLYIMDANGANLKRITAERNGADRPVIDPQTGKIVYSRWWRNQRFAYESEVVEADPNGGYRLNLGLSADRNDQLGGPDYLWRNAWQLASINPDGTGLAMFTGFMRSENKSHVYGGAFDGDGHFLANFFPMTNMSEAAGFGGIRRHPRGPGLYTPLIGITSTGVDYVNQTNPTSYGILNGTYACDPVPLADGRILFSYASDINQDYGLYLMDADGGNIHLVLDLSGTTEIRAKVLQAHSAPPQIPLLVFTNPSALPPTANGPYTQDGTFIFFDSNVYWNADVDVDIVSAPPVGSATSIRFFIDHQRTSPGSFPNLDWPILLDEQPVQPNGQLIELAAPAHVPLFEQLRGKGTVPLTGGPLPDGAAHVAGHNFGSAGSAATCVGCHTGHSMIALPANARYTNLAPSASIRVSSSANPKQKEGLIDRRVLKDEIWRYWTSANDQQSGQWVELVFPVSIEVKQVRLYNPRQGEEANCSIQVHGATVRLFSDLAASQQVDQLSIATDLSVSGTPFDFNQKVARVVRVELDSVSGTFYGALRAGLAEIEVIATGDAPQNSCSLVGDLNGDNQVDQTDLASQWSLWLTNANSPFDANGDRLIDVRDLALTVTNLGTSCK